MAKYKLIKSAIAPATLFCFMSLSHAYAWQNLTVFGDSLSDGGNIGRYTYDGQQHFLYDEIIADHLKDNLNPSGSGGLNYAQGGAVANKKAHPGLNTQEQLTAYLQSRGGHADSNGLYIHWVGANDIAEAATTPSKAQDLIQVSAGSAASQVKTLLNAGAGLIIVPNVPQLGLTPYVVQTLLSNLGASSMAAAFHVLNTTPTPDEATRQKAIRNAFDAAAGQVSDTPEKRHVIAQQLYDSWLKMSAQITRLTDSYNQQEDVQLNGLNGNIARMDIARLFREVIASPQQYGLSNTIGMSCPLGLTADRCHWSDPGFRKGQNFLFADRLHPSPDVHRLMADYMESVLDAPAEIAMLPVSAGLMTRGMHDTLDGHLQQQRLQPTQAGQLTVFGGYAGGRVKAKHPDGINAKSPSRNLSLGMGYQFTDNWQSGVILSNHNQHVVPSSGLSYSFNGSQMAVYSQLTFLDKGWFSADYHYSLMGYDDIHRHIHLGPATRTEHGNSKGYQTGVRAQAGWNFSLNKHVKTGPVVSYSMDKTQVKGYREDGHASTAMRFSDQTLRSKTGSVGWRLESTGLPVNPWVQVMHSHQFGDTESRVRGGLKAFQSKFTRVVKSSDKNWVDTAAGVNIPLGKSVNTYAGMSTVSNKSHYHPVTWNVGINVTF